MRYVVVGAGPAGLAMAGHIAMMGEDVSIYSRFSEEIASFVDDNKLTLKGALQGYGTVRKMSTRMDEVIPEAGAILVVVPAHGHSTVAALMAPLLRDGQLVLLMPGRTGGCLEFAQCLRECDSRAEIILSEAQTVLHTSRCIRGQREVNVLAVKKKLAVAAFPADLVRYVEEVFSPLFPQFYFVSDTRLTGLSNVGAILHPAPTLFNVGRIETSDRPFRHYKDGISPHVASFIEQIDAERCNVAAALEVKVASTTEWLHDVYGTNADNLYDAIQATEYYDTIQAPTSIVHRYLLEDVPTGLVPISELGRATGVDTPCADLSIELASRIMERDFRESGRNLSKLGLSNMNVEEIIAAFRGQPRQSR